MELLLEKAEAQVETGLGVIDICQVEDSTTFVVEIFPENQSKESFEDAEFSNKWDIISDEVLNPDFVRLRHVPREWSWEQVCDMEQLAVTCLYEMLSTIKNLDSFRGTSIYEDLKVIRNKYNDDYCAYCGCKLDDSNRRQNEHEITVCEDCFIEVVSKELEYKMRYK